MGYLDGIFASDITDYQRLDLGVMQFKSFHWLRHHGL